MVELPWPADAGFPEDAWLTLEYRAPERPTKEEGMMSVHVRTANGNLYEVWPRQRAGADWRTYLQHERNFTMSFYNRARLPWRLRENRPVALVFEFYPRDLPAVYEVRKIGLVRMGGKEGAGS